MSVMTNEQWEREFWANVVVHEGHWLWQGRTRTNSPVMRTHRQERSAIRIAWMIGTGTVPPQGRLLRDCDEPLCVNPGHRRLREDVRVGGWCRYGQHVIYEPPYWHSEGNRWRCRTCRRKEDKKRLAVITGRNAHATTSEGAG